MFLDQSAESTFSFLEKNNYYTIVADLEGSNIHNVSISNKWALVLGSEAHGIDKIYNQYNKVTINKFGHMESLNVSVASGILLNELMNNK